MKRICFLAAVVAGLALSGCGTGSPEPGQTVDLATASTYHPVHEGYAEFLAQDLRQISFPHLTDSARYYLPARTERHHENRRSSQLGRAAVQFGKILDVTMQGDEIRAALGRVEKATSAEDANGVLIILALDEFYFKGFRAMVRLDITVRRDGREILSRSYRGAGGRHTRRETRRTGVYALRTAIQASTKEAMDEILEQFMLDLSARLRA